MCIAASYEAADLDRAAPERSGLSVRQFINGKSILNPAQKSRDQKRFSNE